jgi:hypothetical protein
MKATPLNLIVKRFLGTAMVLGTVAVMATTIDAAVADVPRAQMDAGTPETPDIPEVGDAGMMDLDAGVPELQGSLKSSLRSSMDVPE